MVRLAIELSLEESQTLLDEIWFLRAMRQEEGTNLEKAGVLDLAFQVFNEQVGGAKHDEQWKSLMDEISAKK